MLEKIANAICERRNANDWPCNGLDFDTEMAKAALLALRDNVTSDMIILGNRCEGSAEEIFNIMVNKALEYPGL